jgi:hypothetical protein
MEKNQRKQQKAITQLKSEKRQLIEALDTIQSRYETDLQRGKEYLDLTERKREEMFELSQRQQEQQQGQQREWEQQQEEPPPSPFRMNPVTNTHPMKRDLTFLSSSPSSSPLDQSSKQQPLREPQSQYPLMSTYDDVTREVMQWKRLLKIYRYDHQSVATGMSIGTEHLKKVQNTELFLRKVAVAWMRLGKLCFHDSLNSTNLIDSGPHPSLSLSHPLLTLPPRPQITLSWWGLLQQSKHLCQLPSPQMIQTRRLSIDRTLSRLFPSLHPLAISPTSEWSMACAQSAN